MNFSVKGKIILYTLLVSTSALVFWNCKDPLLQQTEIEKLSVLSWITTDTAKQMVYVYNTAYVDEEALETRNEYFIDNAKISISDSSSLVNFKSGSVIGGQKTYLSKVKTKFLPGEKYYLNVEANGAKVTGETTFPGDFKITSPEQNNTIENNGSDMELNIEWTESTGAYGYIVSITYYYMYRNPLGQYEKLNAENTFNTFNNNQNYVIKYPIDPMFLDTTKGIDIKIIAYDKNYYLHHFEQYNNAGLDSAYGYFASAVVKRISLKYK